MKFIKLTEANGNNVSILVNTAHITVVHKGLNTGDTHVRMHGHGVSKDGKFRNEYYFVKETVEEIEKMLIC